MLDKNNWQRLLELLKANFDGRELFALCLNLGIHYEDDLAGEIKEEKLINLLLMLERRDQLQELIDECRKLRPKENWELGPMEFPDHPQEPPKSSKTKNEPPANFNNVTPPSSPQLEKDNPTEPISSTVIGRFRIPETVDSILDNTVKRFLVVQLLILIVVSVLGFVSDFSSIFDLAFCFRLTTTILVVFFAGTIVLGVSLLPSQKQKYKIWDRIVTLILLFGLIVSLTWYQTYKGCSPDLPWASIQVNAQINKFQNSTDSSDRLEVLSNLFNRNSMFVSESHYDGKAFSLFFSLSTDEIITLFAEGQVENSSLILIISKIAPTLFEGYPRSTLVLEAMSERLATIEMQEASNLKEEIDLWMNGRALASHQGTNLQVLQTYQKAAQIDGENPAILLELAKQFYFYGDNELAFIYYDRAIQSAHAHLPLETAESSQNGAFTSVEVVENTILATFVNTPLLYSAYEEQSVKNGFPYLEGLLANIGNENALGFKAVEAEITQHEYSLIQVTSLLPDNQEQSLSEIVFSSSGEIVYSAGNNLSIYFWRIDRYEISSLSPKVAFLQYLTLPQLDTSENGFLGVRNWEILVASSEEGNLNILNQSGDFIYSIALEANNLLDISSPLEGSHIALLANGGRVIQIWDLARRIQSSSLLVSGQKVSSIAFKPYSEELLIAGFEDGSIKAWNHPIDEENNAFLIGRMPDDILEISFTKDGSQFAALDINSNIYIWDSDSFEEIARIENHFGSVTSIEFSIDGNLAVGTQEGAFHLYSITGEHLISHQNYPTAISSLKFSPKEPFLAVGYIDGRIEIYHIVESH